MTRLRISLVVLMVLVLIGCGRPGGRSAKKGQAAPSQAQNSNPGSNPNANANANANSNPTQPVAASAAPSASALKAARSGFQTQLVRRESAKEPVAQPPADLFQVVSFDSPAGKLASYLSPDPKDGKKHPAIIWITGGDCNTIGDVWKSAPPENDQTAGAFRKAGLIMMFPSLRGGNENPGSREGFYGEADDILAAADFLAKQSYVDPQRIYLGGHSTGGTMVLLVSEMSDRFRAVFSFGPVEDIRGYGPDYMPFDPNTPREVELRAPKLWLESIRSPTFVIEGASQGNGDSLKSMAQACKNPLARFHLIRGADHFSVLGPINEFLAEKVKKDDGPTCNLVFMDEELNQAFKQ